MHPVHVTTHRIDLTVVDHEAIRVGTFPTWEGVRTETGMHECNRRFYEILL
ncbi:hypothetical protein D3C74_430760 [compost metagenome]